MENQIYRLKMTDYFTLDFNIIDTNEVKPYKPIKEVEVTVFKEGSLIHGSLCQDGLSSLIKYLSDCKDYITEFNRKSKAEVNTCNNEFYRNDIEQLQSKIHKITGDGEIMQIFNDMLGVQAG